MELKHYLQILQRWAWLLILGAVAGALAAYYYAQTQQPVYQASTRAMVMRAPLEQSSDYTCYSDMQLVQTYVQLLTPSLFWKAHPSALATMCKAN